MFCEHCGQLLKHAVILTGNNGLVERWVPATWNDRQTATPPTCPRQTGHASCTPERRSEISHA